MKKVKIFYWISTILFAAMMGLTAYPDVVMEKETVDFIVKLGYPLYFIPFIGVAKILGSISILIPNFGKFNFDKIKEWAYAGLVFDLIGATYSNIIVHGMHPEMLVMSVFFIAGGISYIYNEKLKKLQTEIAE